MAGEARCFRGHAFHQIAVADDRIGKVIDDVEPRAIVACCQMGFGDRHADAVAKALTERTGCCLHAGRVAALGMPGRAAAPLAKLLDLVEWHIVAGQMEHAVKQHGSMARRKDETITIRPRRVLRIMFKKARPQNIRSRRETHGRARMTGVGFLHGVHGEHSNSIDT